MYKIGYTTGVYDLFHVGHVNLLRNAKSMCETLIVGVTSDLAAGYKNVVPTQSEQDRMEIVRACRYVDLVVPQTDMDKTQAFNKLKFDALFVGDDWYSSATWKSLEKKLSSHGVKVIYFPYTEGVSSTKRRALLNE